MKPLIGDDDEITIDRSTKSHNSSVPKVSNENPKAAEETEKKPLTQSKRTSLIDEIFQYAEQFEMPNKNNEMIKRKGVYYNKQHHLKKDLATYKDESLYKILIKYKNKENKK